MNFKHSVTVESVDAYPIRAAGGVSPNMALGVMSTRPALLVRVRDDHGCVGWGEVWANFPPRANIHKAQVIEDVIAPRLRGVAFSEPVEIDAFLRRALSTYFLHVGQKRVFEHILAGMDVALWDLVLRSAGRTFAAHSGLAEASAPTYASSINPPDLERLMQHHAERGQSQFKLKLGFDDTADRAFVRKAAAIRPPGTHIMIDSNQTWDVSRAEAMLGSLEEFEPLFAEEPIPADAGCADWERLAQSTSIPLAGGENLYGVDEFLRMADAGLRFVQPDVAKWGGVSGALALARALPPGVALWPHFMGTSVGQVAALSVAAAVGATATCEMDVNANPLRTDLCGDILGIRDGRVALPDAPGLVVPPVRARLEEFREAQAD
ncbi:MAG: mandelate racemase/muconate lactonizing enzyme family protein [Deltaproteobacteria bacterium]|nr:mandelate racemase/muconate lactonizing enzyme family protein [Deltaproteobacteria bacterium]